MASTVDQLPRISERGSSDYPTGDGRPMAESDLHRDLIFAMIEVLKAHYAGQQVYVTGNLLVFYEPTNKRRHVSPDVMVVKGVEPGLRLNYLTWQEVKLPSVVIEITSKSTRSEDVKTKFEIYRTILRVQEYFLFDPTGDYLSPRLQGYRLVDAQYVPIEATGGRLFSEELALCLDSQNEQLRLYEPVEGRWLPTVAEMREMARQAEQQARQKAEQVESENERLKREIDELRRRISPHNG